jgi:hypothetical protein
VTQLISTLSLFPSAEVEPRGSVRRASGFVQIPITLKTPPDGRTDSANLRYGLITSFGHRCRLQGENVDAQPGILGTLESPS